MNLHIIIAMLLSLSACTKDKYQDDEFSLNRAEYNGNELRIDGYYASKAIGEDYSYLYVFYQNGVLLKPGVAENTDEYIQKFVDGFNHNIKDFWGIYQIQDSTIQVEFYKPKMTEGLPAYIKTGKILNDTTFILTNEKRSKDGSESRAISETYHFREYSPKPDSTNTFIK